MPPSNLRRHPVSRIAQALLLKERAEHAAALLAKDSADAENERLRQIIKALQRHRFGRRAETLDADPLDLGLEDIEQEIAAGEAGAEAAAPAARTERVARRRANRGSLPAHLLRIETVVDIEDKTCPGCRGALHRIGEDVAERLDIVPAQLQVLVVRRPSTPVGPARTAWCRRLRQRG